MGMRSFAKVSSEILFTIFLSLLIVVFSLANFTSYENLKPVFLNIAKQQINMTPQQLNSTYTTLLQLCNISRNETIYVESLEIKCSDVFSSRPENLPDLIGSSTFEKIYFKKYDCQFFQCISLPGQDKFLFLLSDQANIFFKKSIIYLELVVVLSAVILIASVETWSGRFKALGLSLIFVGAADFVLILLKGLLTQNLPQQVAESANPIINQILDSVSNMYLIIFIAGVVLFIIGLVMSYLRSSIED